MACVDPGVLLRNIVFCFVSEKWLGDYFLILTFVSLLVYKTFFLNEKIIYSIFKDKNLNLKIQNSKWTNLLH